jgi:hypothetical protein
MRPPVTQPPPNHSPEPQESGQERKTSKVYIRPELKDLGLLRTVTKFSF